MTCVFKEQKDDEHSWSGEEEVGMKRGSIAGDEFREVTVMGSHLEHGLIGHGQYSGSYLTWNHGKVLSTGVRNLTYDLKGSLAAG